jgi:hypothetical protein
MRVRLGAGAYLVRLSRLDRLFLSGEIPLSAYATRKRARIHRQTVRRLGRAAQGAPC